MAKAGTTLTPGATYMATLGAAKRGKLYTQAQKILQDDCPSLWAYAIQDIYAINKKVEWTPRTDEMIWYQEMSLA